MSDKQKQVEVNGNDYTLQKIPPREWVRLRERTKDRMGRINEENFISEILKHVVVDPPGLKMDDFEEYWEVEEVVQEAVSFLQGRREG